MGFTEFRQWETGLKTSLESPHRERVKPLRH